MKSFLFALILCLTGAALFYAVKERGARHDTERLAEAQKRRAAQLTAEIGKNERQLASAEHEMTRVATALEAARQKASSAAKPTTMRIVPLTPELAQLREAMKRDPQAQNAHFADIRLRYAETCQPVAKELNLSATQYAQLIDNLMKRYEERTDLGVALEMKAPGASAAEQEKMWQQINDRFRAEQVALLGDTGDAKFDSYERTLPLRQFVDDFAGRAAVAGSPITGAQADALIAAMADASPLYRQGQAATTQALEWDAVLNRASTELPEASFALFKNLVIPRWNMDRLQALARKK